MDIMEEAEDITSTFKGYLYVLYFYFVELASKRLLSKREILVAGSGSRSRKRISLSSILKASPSRQALADVDANQREVTNIVNPGKAERRKRRRSSKRVSFANTHEVKEFLTEKDARTLGILEVSADSSAVMQADNRHSYESTSQIPPVVSVGPGHHITGLETLLTAPIVQQPQMAEESPSQNDEGVDAVLSKIMKNFRAQQETSVENKTSPEVNLDPEPAREEPTSIAPSDFFKRITFDRPARSRDQAECGEMSERTIFFKQSKDSDDGNMEMTGNYDNTIHQETEVTQQFKQQVYFDNLGLLGPTYTCRMKAYESSDTSSLHNSSVNNSANISNLSSRETRMRNGSQDKPQEVDNITRVFTMEDASADMELTQVHGIKSQSVRRDDRIVNNPSLVKIASDDLTRVFNQEDQTGMMEMTKCIDADQRNYQTRDRQPLGLSEQSRGTGYEEITRVYGQGDITAGMEFTEPIPAREIKSSAEERTRIFQTNDQAGAMDMTSVCNVSGRVLPAVAKQEDDKTVVFDLRGGTSGDVELTECLQVYPLDKENHCPATSGDISRQHLHEGMSVASKIDRTKIYQIDDGGEMEMTECVNPGVQSRSASKQIDQSLMSAGAKKQGEMLFGNQDAGVEDEESQHKNQKQNDKSCVSFQAGNRKPTLEGLDQHHPTSSSRVKDERDKENMLAVMPEPTVELGDLSLLPCGPLDSTHIFQNEHLGRRSAFFPSSALKQQREEQNDTSMNAANTSTCRESTRKVMEGINALLASNSSTEKTRQALQALSSREAKMYGSRQSKAKVGLFQDKSAKYSSSMPTPSHGHKDDGKKTLKIADERKKIQEAAKLPAVSSSQRDRLCDVTSELPSMLLNTTSSMRYSSMTLDDDLLNSTNHPPTAKTLSSHKSKTPVGGKKMSHSDIEATVEVTATYNKQTKETVRGDKTSTRPAALHPADTLTRRFSADDEGDMEFTSCVNEKIDFNLDKENVFPSSMASSGRNVSFPQERPQMLVMDAVNNHPKVALEGHSKVQDGHQNDENQTRRFGSEDTGAMEFTACVPPISKGTDRVVSDHTMTGKTSQAPAFVEDQTRRFGSDDTAGMEFTACVPPISKGTDKLVSDHTMAGIASQAPAFVEDQTRRFGSDDTAGMEFTACVPLISKGTDRVVSDHTMAGKTSQAPAFVEDQTRRFGSEDTAGMEFTACVPPISKGTDRVVSDHTTAGKTLQAPAFVENQTRRFGSDDTAGMEFTACVPPISKGTDRVVSDHTTAGKTSQAPAFVQDQTLRFGSDDTAGMEFTACVPPISKGTDRVVSDHTMTGKTLQAPAFVEDQTRRFGSDDTAGMEFTACVPAGSKETDGNVSDPILNTSQKHTVHTMKEDETRHFGVNDGEKMEFTACVKDQLDDPPSDGTIQTVRSNPQAETKVSSKEQEKTQIYRDGMTEMMDLTNIHFKAQTDQDHLDGSPPCKKSKPTQVGEEASTKTLSSETTTAETMMPSCERGVTPVAGESSREAGEPILPAPKGITDGIVCVDGASSGEVGNGPMGGRELLQSKDEERNERSCNATEKPGRRDSSRRKSDTFTLETSNIAGPEIDKGNETMGVQEEQPSLILNQSETRNRSLAGLSLLAEDGLLVHDGSFDGIMEEEFQSPECTEDLAGFELGKQPLSLNGKAMDGSHISVPELQQEIEGAGSEKDKMDIPDTLTVAEFCNLFQNSDDALVDAKFGRETLVPIDLKTPEELEEYLQVLLIIKPDQEIHDWALTQLQTMLTKLQSGLQIQKQQMMKDKFPEIFQKLQSLSEGHKIPKEVSDLHSYCMKFSRNQFHEWNLKMKTQLEEDLKYGIEKLTPRVSKCSEGLIKIESKMKELDDVMTNLDNAIGNLDEMSLPTEEEMDEFVNNKKRQTEEKDSLKSKRDEVVQGVKHLEERKVELMRVNTDEERGLKNTDIARITENLTTLHCLQEWRLEGSSDSGNKLHFTFLNRSLDLTVEYDTEASKPTKLTQLILRSYLPDTACPIAKLIHRLILQTAHVEDLKAKHANYSNLPMLLQILSRTVVRARQLEREMRNIAFWHLVDINEYSLLVQFSSLKAHSSFRVTFDFNNCLLGEQTITAAHEIGRDMVQDVQRALLTVKPGPGQLTRTMDCLNQLLETLTV
ncbi:hypothetical protein BSL78_19041 [Apostichopus japonicus]|uniref:Knl1 C-terminal RWD domain-containing protein n=1 Tax=Stichopus japonicus TaxID=307972 RepID=A0A2G8K803_STIJA|nr:hypothetical protein BSL78_19041 [Apostichopus japonicus]